MRQVAVSLALSLVVAGCGLLSEPSPSEPFPSGRASLIGDAGGWENCPITVWVTGVIIPNADGYAAIRGDDGVVRGLVWGSSNTAVVEWGRRYRIGGTWFNTPAYLWACGGADAVIPQ